MSSSNEASQLSNRLTNMDHNRPPIQNSRELADQRPSDRYYPAKFDFDPSDKTDRMRELKVTAPPEFGMKYLDQSDLEYIDKKAQQIELEKFDRWYGTIFDHKDPAQLQLSKQIYPEWFERRLKAIDETVDFQRSMARINILGIQNKEDVLTAYAVASGRIDPEVYNIQVMNPQALSDEVVGKQYVYGFYSPYRFSDRTQDISSIAGATMPLVQGGTDVKGSGYGIKSVGELTALMQTKDTASRNTSNFFGTTRQPTSRRNAVE